MTAASYVGRFAPSPSGPLHMGSLLAALASYLDARAHGGRWLLRIEDIDTGRSVPGADRLIMAQLQALGLKWDDGPVWQTQRQSFYQAAFARLQAAGRTYACTCRRRELPAGPYPGTCRPPVSRPGMTRSVPPTAPTESRSRGRTAWRFRVAPGVETFFDRWQGPHSEDVAAQTGDFIIRRSDGIWAYQFVVVVDDALQGVTDVVRGADLLDSTARQRQLARALGLPSPRTLHVPLACDAAGHKLSKQHHAPALPVDQPLACLQQAWQALGFPPITVRHRDEFMARAIAAWAHRFDKSSAS